MKLNGGHDPGHQQNVVPSGFFALRTPLLPFDELLVWGDGLEGPTLLVSIQMAETRNE